jgi:peptide/nickel transport system ATP-binding protein
MVAAVDGVSLCLPRGRTVALVGETGCGKTVLGLSLMRLVPPPGRVSHGRVMLHVDPGEGVTDLLTLPERRMRALRGGRLAMIFQEPLSALNPVLSVGAQIVEAVELHQAVRGRAARSAAADLLARVGLADPRRRLHDYPHQLSGGMQQRMLIAMALACRPLVLIADEPTTALDGPTQAQILDLLRAVQAETALSLLLITHDLRVVAQIADRVYVMYAGRIVEHGSVSAVLGTPAHPYTQALLGCTPRLDGPIGRLPVIPGSVPDPAHFPAGCRFHPRCALAERLGREAGRPTAVVRRSDESVMVTASCQVAHKGDERGPALREIKPDHFAACWEL